MSRISDLRTNIVAVIRALPALAGITVEEIAAPSDVWAIPSVPAIGVCRLKPNWTPDGPEIGKFDDQPFEVRFAAIIKTDSPLSNIDGLVLAEDLAEAVLGIRGSQIGTSDTGPVTLYGEDWETFVHPKRAEGGAGPIATVVHFKATEFSY